MTCAASRQIVTCRARPKCASSSWSSKPLTTTRPAILRGHHRFFEPRRRHALESCARRRIRRVRVSCASHRRPAHVCCVHSSPHRLILSPDICTSYLFVNLYYYFVIFCTAPVFAHCIVALLCPPTPVITCALYSVISFPAISELLHTVLCVSLFSVSLLLYNVFVAELYSSTPLSSVILCFHLSLVCAYSPVPTATLYRYYVLLALSDFRRPFARVRCLQLPLLSRCPFSLTLYYIALNLPTFEESVIAELLIHNETPLVDNRPPLTLISSFVDLSILFRRRRMWQSTRYSPRYLLVDPHTSLSKPSFVVLLLVLENILF